MKIYIYCGHQNFTQIHIDCIGIHPAIIKNSKFLRPGCGLKCGPPFQHHCVGVIIKGPEDSPPWRFPSHVKRFLAQIPNMSFVGLHQSCLVYFH